MTKLSQGVVIALERIDENCRIPFEDNFVYPYLNCELKSLYCSKCLHLPSTFAGSWICCESKAKTSPTSLRTTTPIPAQFSLLKSAPSKFILTLSWSRGLQQEASVVVDGDAGLWNVENSGNLSFACSSSWDSDDVNLPRQKLFRWFHIVHTTIKDKAGFLFSAKIKLMISMKLWLCISLLCFHYGHLLHKSWSFRQEYKAWTTSSLWVLQQSQVPSAAITFLRTRFDFVGRESLHARHNRFFTLEGTFNFQIACHSDFEASGFKELGCWLWNSFCRNLYPDFTVYSPDGLCGDVKVSCCCVFL